MRLVPRKVADKIQFCQTHLDLWQEHPEEIGTTIEAVNDLQAKMEAARAAYRAQQEAYAAAQSATLALKIVLDEMSSANSAIIMQIRGKARMAGADVYPLAGIPIPQKASTTPPPGNPYSFSVRLDGTGALRLKWKCDNPRGTTGTMYLVSRQIGENEGFVPLGTAGGKEFIDNTIPAGTAAVLYKVQAIRSTAVGNAALFPVSLGVRGKLPPGMKVKSRTMQIAA
jgi:type II secretory pathway pseudopilin PulG